jgi:hypothetical protein
MKGYKTNRNGDNANVLRWSDHTVWHILRNPNYTGDLVQGRYVKPTYKSKSVREKKNSEDWIIVEATHEAIVSREDYERVQAAKDSRGAHNRNASVSRPVSNVFAGIVKCKLCGRSLILSSSGNLNKNARYLRCAGRKTGIANCTCAMVKYNSLVEVATNKIRELINIYCDPDQLERQALRRDFSEEIMSAQKMQDRNLFEFKRVGDALSSSYIDKTSGVLSDGEFAVISANLREKREKLEEDGRLLHEQINKLRAKQNAGDRVTQIIARYRDFLELDRDIVRAFIEVILVGERDAETNDYDLEIVYNF